MGWLFGKKKIAPAKKGEKAKEIPVLVKEEEEASQKAVKYVSDALSIFISFGNKVYYGSNASAEKGCVAWPKDNISIQGLRTGFSAVAAPLLNAGMYTKKIVKLSQRMEADLMDIRGGTKDRKADYLSSDEHRILSFSQDIDNHIQEVVAKIKVLVKIDFNEIENKGYLEPKNKKLGADVKNLMDEIHRGIVAIKQSLIELYELEKKVEVLSEEYVKAA